MAIANTSWYRNGTISIATNATKVYGSGTQWLSAGINPGATLRIDGTYHALEILAVVSDTEIDLRVAYTGEAVTNAAYSIDRNFQSTLPADIAAGVANMTGKYERYIDSDLQKITGESAYDIAFKNGFTGTESEWLDSLNAYGVAKKGGYTGTLQEWLESLKAAGEWEEADSRITALEGNVTTFNYIKALYEASQYTNEAKATLHRQIYRGKSLGNAPTTAQLAAIRAGTYDDIYLGDYWEVPINITFPLLNEADPANGDTWTNQTEPVTLNTTLRWTIIDLGYPVYTSGSQANPVTDPITGQPLTYWGGCNNNVVIMPKYDFGIKWPMNYKNSNECGYEYSLINTKILPALYQAIKPTFDNGNSKLRCFLRHAFDGNNGVAAVHNYLFLPSVSEVGEASPLVWTGPFSIYGVHTMSTGQIFAMMKYNPVWYDYIGGWFRWSRDVAVAENNNYEADTTKFFAAVHYGYRQVTKHSCANPLTFTPYAVVY